MTYSNLDMDYARNFQWAVASYTKSVVCSVLEEFRSLYRWQNTRDDVERTALDIGFGDGFVTVEVIKPFLPTSTRLDGADKSEDMIRFAKYCYEEQGFKFFFWDVEGEILDKSMLKSYDHIFSFFCLHYVEETRWVLLFKVKLLLHRLKLFRLCVACRLCLFVCVLRDGRPRARQSSRGQYGGAHSSHQLTIKALQNICDILKPNGNVVLTLVPNLPFHDAMKTVSINPKWSSYMQDIDTVCPRPFAKEKFPHKVFAELMSECGFRNVITKLDVKNVLIDSWERLEAQLRHVDIFRKRMPLELQEEYFAELMSNVKQMEGFWTEKETDTGEFVGVLASFEVLTAYGEKGSH